MNGATEGSYSAHGRKQVPAKPRRPPDAVERLVFSLVFLGLVVVVPLGAVVVPAWRGAQLGSALWLQAELALAAYVVLGGMGTIATRMLLYRASPLRLRLASPGWLAITLGVDHGIFVFVLSVTPRTEPIPGIVTNSQLVVIPLTILFIWLLRRGQVS